MSARVATLLNEFDRRNKQVTSLSSVTSGISSVSFTLIVKWCQFATGYSNQRVTASRSWSISCFRPATWKTHYQISRISRSPNINLSASNAPQFQTPILGHDAGNIVQFEYIHVSLKIKWFNIWYNWLYRVNFCNSRIGRELRIDLFLSTLSLVQ